MQKKLKQQKTTITLCNENYVNTLEKIPTYPRIFCGTFSLF